MTGPIFSMFYLFLIVSTCSASVIKGKYGQNHKVYRNIEFFALDIHLFWCRVFAKTVIALAGPALSGDIQSAFPVRIKTDVALRPSGQKVNRLPVVAAESHDSVGRATEPGNASGDPVESGAVKPAAKPLRKVRSL